MNLDKCRDLVFNEDYASICSQYESIECDDTRRYLLSHFKSSNLGPVESKAYRKSLLFIDSYIPERLTFLLNLVRSGNTSSMKVHRHNTFKKLPAYKPEGTILVLFYDKECSWRRVDIKLMQTSNMALSWMTIKFIYDMCGDLYHMWSMDNDMISNTHTYLLSRTGDAQDTFEGKSSEALAKEELDFLMRCGA